MDELRPCVGDELVGGLRRRRRSPSPTAPGKRSRIAAATRVERDDSGQRGEAAEQGSVRQRPAEVLAREVGGRHGEQSLRRERADEVVEPELVERAGRVDQDDSRPVRGRRRGRPGGAASGPGRSARPARRSARGCGSAGRRCGRTRRPARRCAPSRRSGTPARGALGERCDRQKLGGGDDALAAAPVDADLEHAGKVRRTRRLTHRSAHGACSVVCR